MSEAACKWHDGSSTMTTVEYAARLCDMHEAGGYDVWFLPSREELEQMYQRLVAQDLGNFSLSSYWSSSEYDA